MVVPALFLAIGSVFGLLSVAFGAFGAHALKSRLTPTELGVFQTGVQYQMFHALGLVGVGLWLQGHVGSRYVAAAGWLFTIGILLFSGSLYILTLSKIKRFGAMTPLGGVALMIGWSLLFFSAFHS